MKYINIWESSTLLPCLLNANIRVFLAPVPAVGSHPRQDVPDLQCLPVRFGKWELQRRNLAVPHRGKDWSASNWEQVQINWACNTAHFLSGWFLAGTSMSLWVCTWTCRVLNNGGHCPPPTCTHLPQIVRLFLRCDLSWRRLWTKS